jgi:hypothetical protein
VEEIAPKVVRNEVTRRKQEETEKLRRAEMEWRKKIVDGIHHSRLENKIKANKVRQEEE